MARIARRRTAGSITTGLNELVIDQGRLTDGWPVHEACPKERSLERLRMAREEAPRWEAERQAERAAEFDKENFRKPKTRKMPVVVGAFVYEAEVRETGYHGLWNNGTISDYAFHAAAALDKEFARAGYDACKTTNLTGAGGGGMTLEDIYLRRASGPNYVHVVIRMLGGPGKRLAQAVIEFVCYGRSIREIAEGSGKSRDYWTALVVEGLEVIGEDYKGMMRGERSRGRLQFSGDRPDVIPSEDCVLTVAGQK